jgi:hypothetical protein
VKNDAARELDIEMAHAQRPLHGFSGCGEDLGQDLVQGVLEAFVLALATLLGDLPSTLQLGVVTFVVGWLLGLAGVADLLANLVDEGAYLLVGARLHLGL